MTDKSQHRTDPVALPFFSGVSVWHLLMTRGSSRSGHRTALRWHPFNGEPQSWTYAELAREVAAVAAGMVRRGTRPGDRVLLHLENCPEFIISWFACAAVGAVAVATNTRSSEDELSYYVEHSRISAFITQPKFAASLGRVAANVSWFACTSHDGGETAPDTGMPERTSSYAALHADARELVSFIPHAHSPLSVQYTSGTTSRPKGVVWSHANGMWAARTNAVHEGLRPDDRFLCYLPLFHTNALAYQMLAAFWVGAELVLIPKWSTSRFWEISTQYSCTWLSVIGLSQRAILGLETPRSHSYRCFGLRLCDLEWDEKLGIKSLGWWGMTETVSQPIMGDPYTANRRGSMGRPTPEYEVAVVRETGLPVEADETGDLLIRGTRGITIFSEYLNDPIATAESFTPAGWFKTGDRVMPHADGHITFTDRAKDMLRVGGENVAASEIERVILGVPGVTEAAVVGKPDSALDEVPIAFVIGAGQPAPLRQAILDACRAKLAQFKIPRDVIVVHELPRATLDKVNKAQLRKELISGSTSPPSN
jgi:carnitine-CoA ligase